MLLWAGYHPSMYLLFNSLGMFLPSTVYCFTFSFLWVDLSVILLNSKLSSNSIIFSNTSSISSSLDSNNRFLYLYFRCLNTSNYGCFLSMSYLSHESMYLAVKKCLVLNTSPEGKCYLTLSSSTISVPKFPPPVNTNPNVHHPLGKNIVGVSAIHE